MVNLEASNVTNLFLSFANPKQFRHSRHLNITNSFILHRVKSMSIVNNTNLMPNHPLGQNVFF